MYWPFTAVPELADLPPAEQRRYWAEAGRDRSSRRDLAAVTAMLGAVGLAAGVLLIVAELVRPAWLRGPLRFVLFALGGVAVQAIMVRHNRGVLRRRHRRRGGW